MGVWFARSCMYDSSLECPEKTWVNVTVLFVGRKCSSVLLGLVAWVFFVCRIWIVVIVRNR